MLPFGWRVLQLVFLQLPVEYIQNPHIAGLPRLVAAAVVDDNGMLPYPVQTVAGVCRVGIVKGKDAVA